MACLKAEVSVLVDGAARNPVARALVHGHAFPRQHRFVHGGFPFGDDAVHRHALARAHADDISHRDFRHRDFDFLAFAQDRACLGRQAHQLFNGAAAFALGPHFQRFAQEHQREDDGRGLKVELMDRLLVAHGDLHQRPEAVRIGSQGPHGNQRVHVRPAAQERPHTVGIKVMAYDHHRRGQQELYHRQDQGRHGQRHAQHHRPHGQAKQRNGQRCAGNQALFLPPGFPLARLAAVRLVVHKEPGLLDGPAEDGHIHPAVVIGDRCLLRSKVDLRALHAFDIAEHILQPRRARGAVHAPDGQRNLLHAHNPLFTRKPSPCTAASMALGS